MLRAKKGQFIKGQISPRRTNIFRNCLVCGDQFKVLQSNIDKGKSIYCSQKCAWSNNHIIFKRNNKNCEQCKKSFYPKSANQVYCTRLCGNSSRVGKPGHPRIVTEEQRAKQSIAQKKKYQEGFIPWNKGLKGYMNGSQHYNWKGGITPKNKIDRQTFSEQVLLKVLKRDNYTCQICQQYSGRLHVDHIEKWSDNEDLRFEMKNCRTVCIGCHYYITFKRKMPIGSKWGITTRSKTI